MIYDKDPVDVDSLLSEDVGIVDVEISAGSVVPIDGTLVDWRTLPDTDARAAWNSLREWVEWFTVRYQIPVSIVPACWYRHGRLVEELSALHAAHTSAFDPLDSGLGPIGWHERLDLALPRLRHAYYGGCSNSHQSYSPRSWAKATEEQAWNRWARDAHSP